ncbi:MAG: sn-glycerol-3-phosphate ABC transporter substrate-binding protein UgpB [Candidatus Acetothermia bacterium]|jgi:sn-glycerol 3-phosphate transport system substrate-binding protein|nr:sn-glycerol-3-phosphate ABC transporter substrate-binding protein UgpB [Candidatus Acetothermia bacterium]
MKRFLVLVLAMATIGGLAVGQGKVTIEFWHAATGALADALNTVVNDFNNSQTTYFVNAVYKGSYAETMSAAIAAFRAGKPPHIVQIFEVGTATMMAATGAIYPVYQLMADTGVPFDPEQYIAPVKGYYSDAAGRMVSMPFNSSTAVLWYNKDAFRAAGLDPDNPPRTWAEVRAAAKKIVETGAAKIGLSCAWLTWTQFEQFGAIHNTPFATRANGFEGMDAVLELNHPLYVRHLQTLIDMAKEGSFTYGGRDATPDALFPSGEAAMLIASSALRARVAREAKFEWGVTYLPYYDDAVQIPHNSIIGGASLWVMRRPDASLELYKGVAEFFRFISQPEADAKWHMTTGYVPLTFGGYEVAKAEGYYDQNPGADIPILQLARPNPTENTRGLRLGNLPSIRTVIYEEVEKALQGQQTAQQALDNVVKRGNAILREFEATHK